MVDAHFCFHLVSVKRVAIRIDTAGTRTLSLSA